MVIYATCIKAFQIVKYSVRGNPFYPSIALSGTGSFPDVPAM